MATLIKKVLGKLHQAGNKSAAIISKKYAMDLFNLSFNDPTAENDFRELWAEETKKLLPRVGVFLVLFPIFFMLQDLGKYKVTWATADYAGVQSSYIANRVVGIFGGLLCVLYGVMHSRFGFVRHHSQLVSSVLIYIPFTSICVSNWLIHFDMNTTQYQQTNALMLWGIPLILRLRFSTVRILNMMLFLLLLVYIASAFPVLNTEVNTGSGLQFFHLSPTDLVLGIFSVFALFMSSLLDGYTAELNGRKLYAAMNQRERVAARKSTVAMATTDTPKTAQQSPEQESARKITIKSSDEEADLTSTAASSNAGSRKGRAATKLFDERLHNAVADDHGVDTSLKNFSISFRLKMLDDKFTEYQRNATKNAQPVALALLLFSQGGLLGLWSELSNIGGVPDQYKELYSGGIIEMLMVFRVLAIAMLVGLLFTAAPKFINSLHNIRTLMVVLFCTLNAVMLGICVGYSKRERELWEAANPDSALVYRSYYEDHGQGAHLFGAKRVLMACACALGLRFTRFLIVCAFVFFGFAVSYYLVGNLLLKSTAHPTPEAFNATWTAHNLNPDTGMLNGGMLMSTGVMMHLAMTIVAGTIVCRLNNRTIINRFIVEGNTRNLYMEEDPSGTRVLSKRHTRTNLKDLQTLDEEENDHGGEGLNATDDDEDGYLQDGGSGDDEEAAASRKSIN